jgi:hypothetical protein
MAKNNSTQNNGSNASQPENNGNQNNGNKTVTPVLLQTYTVKQFNFGIPREGQGTILVKVFSAPYALWWIGQDNKPIDLAPYEVDAIHQYLRTMQNIRREMNQQQFAPPAGE